MSDGYKRFREPSAMGIFKFVLFLALTVVTFGALALYYVECRMEETDILLCKLLAAAEEAASGGA